MTPDERALRDAWIAEMWAPVHEIPREDRAAEKARTDACGNAVRGDVKRSA